MQLGAKPVNLAVIAAMTVGFLLIFGLGQGLRAAETAPSPQAVLGVDEFMKNVDRYRGKVSLEGVVSAVAPEQQALSLIDCGEFQACGVTTCAQLTLPVQWPGPLPKVGDRVRIDGKVQEVQGKLMFVAEKLEKVSRQ